MTDFIGSGKRAFTYLEAAWRVRSVKSWVSGKQIVFQVIAYSATSKGLNAVSAHSTSPEVSIVTACPTIKDSFPGNMNRIRDLCIKYDPIAAHPIWSLGYEGTGALIAFAHGCPNNSPRLLHSTRKGALWKPLFIRRVTAPFRNSFSKDSSFKTHQDVFRRMGDEQLADSPWLSRLTSEGRVMLIVMAALRRGRRDSYVISRRTGLAIQEIDAVLAIARDLKWISNDRKLTDQGLTELEQARKRERSQPALSNSEKALYLPRSLRMPRESSSRQL